MPTYDLDPAGLKSQHRRTFLWAGAGLGAASLLLLAIAAAAPTSTLPTHLACWRSSPLLVVLHLTGDAMTWAAYTIIPFLALYLLYYGRVDASPVTFPALLVWGAVFIWCCGQTHLLDGLEVWWAVQWARGGMKVITGLVSWRFTWLLIAQRRDLLGVARAIYRAVAEEEATRGDVPPSASRPLSAVLVDDHEMFRRSLALWLREADITVVGEAGARHDAVEAAARLRPDVVLIDLRLPGGFGAGVAAVREIRATLPACLIVAVAGADDERAAALAAGADDFLEKSGSPREIVDSVNRLLAARQGAGAP